MAKKKMWDQFLDRRSVRSVWVGEKRCRNSWRKELESNKELYLSHEENHVADKKTAFREILIRTSGENIGPIEWFICPHCVIIIKT